MLRTDKILARVQPYVGSGGGPHGRGMGAIADLMRMGIPWWVGLFMLAMLFALPNIMATRLSKIWLQLPGLDKPTHFIAFIAVFLVVYGVVLSRRWPGSARAKRGLAVCISLGISLADELQQAVLGMGRTAEFGDLVADASGVLVGLTGIMAGRLGRGRAVTIAVLLFVPVTAVTAKTYHDLKHFYRGMTYEREHDYRRARAEYQLALDSGFQSAELYNTIAWLDIEFLDADPVKAEGYVARALAMDPNNPDILDTYGWVLVQSGRPREGLPFLERANLLKPGIYCINVHLGVGYMKAGDRNRAADYLKRQIERNAADRWGRSAQLALDQLQGNAG